MDTLPHVPGGPDDTMDVRETMPSPAEILMTAARGERVRDDVAPYLAAAAAEGMLGLVARSAESVPRALRVQLMAMEARSAGMVAELARIAGAFDEAGVPLLAYKGAILAQQLYGSAGARAFSDLDVIVDPSSADAGEAILRTLGYRECQPLSASQRRTNRRFVGETLFLDDTSGVLADFHWLFSHVQFPLRIPFADAWRRRQSIDVDGHPFQTLGNTDLVVLTCSHAAKHLWHRLELLAQIGALAKREADWNAVDRLALAAGAARQTGLSFLLAHDLLEIATPPLPQCMAAAGPVFERVREIVARNLFAETRRMDAAGSDHFLLADRRRDALRSLLLGALVPTHADWQGSPLPDALQWIARPFRLLRKRLPPL